jgi:hypothetical protein
MKIMLLLYLLALAGYAIIDDNQVLLVTLVLAASIIFAAKFATRMFGCVPRLLKQTLYLFFFFAGMQYMFALSQWSGGVAEAGFVDFQFIHIPFLFAAATGFFMQLMYAGSPRPVTIQALPVPEAVLPHIKTVKKNEPQYFQILNEVATFPIFSEGTAAYL